MVPFFLFNPVLQGQIHHAAWIQCSAAMGGHKSKIPSLHGLLDLANKYTKRTVKIEFHANNTA